MNHHKCNLTISMVLTHILDSSVTSFFGIVWAATKTKTTRKNGRTNCSTVYTTHALCTDWWFHMNKTSQTQIMDNNICQVQLKYDVQYVPLHSNIEYINNDWNAQNTQHDYTHIHNYTHTHTHFVDFWVIYELTCTHKYIYVHINKFAYMYIMYCV